MNLRENCREGKGNRHFITLPLLQVTSIIYTAQTLTTSLSNAIKAIWQQK